MLDDLLSRLPLVILTHGARRLTGPATHADHSDIVDAIADGNPALARRVLARHLHALREALDLGAATAPPKTLREMLQR
jgi:DNA-binding GntR family transcriptional regulator